MKALFVGLGSIGARHLANLSRHCREQKIPLEVTALRSSQRELPLETAALLDEELTSLPPDSEYDLAFITNPTYLHALPIGELKGRVHAFFIEKPIFDHPGYDLDVLGLGPDQKAYVAAPMRHTALFAAVKKVLENGCAPFSVRAICSSYLPDWRKNTDYRDVYSAKKAMGGGVTLDLIHEWDYLADLFGLPVKSYNLRGQYSQLEIDSDDLSIYVAAWPQMLAEVHLDYFGRSYRRTLEMLCEEGSYLADFGSGRLTLPDGSEQDHSEDPGRRYEREMAYFVNYALAGVGESMNSPQKALQVLRVAWGDEANG